MKNTVWQDEKDFILEILVNLQNDGVYGKEKETDIPDENLLSSTKKMSKKFTVSTSISWHGLIKPFFVSKMVSKLTKKTIADICVRSLLWKKLLSVMLYICSRWSTIFSISLGTRFS